jgi:hypothetical protein
LDFERSGARGRSDPVPGIDEARWPDRLIVAKLRRVETTDSGTNSETIG